MSAIVLGNTRTYVIVFMSYSLPVDLPHHFHLLLSLSCHKGGEIKTACIMRTREFARNPLHSFFGSTARTANLACLKARLVNKCDNVGLGERLLINFWPGIPNREVALVYCAGNGDMERCNLLQHWVSVRFDGRPLLCNLALHSFRVVLARRSQRKTLL